jgi:xanthine dehydrogenase YagS FAD-binding subunit
VGDNDKRRRFVRPFEHLNAKSVAEACDALRTWNGRARLNAGGTDLLLTLKGDFLPQYPEVVINIKEIAGLDSIREKNGVLEVGALTRLSDVAASPLVREWCPVLADAAHSVASPQIRNAATLGGNLCQDVRCWYYRYPRRLGGPLQCLRKGAGPCLAIKGDNRYHGVLGSTKCFAVCPSDTAVALAALDARLLIAGPEKERSMRVTDFYSLSGTALRPGEMLTAVEIPKVTSRAHQKFLKFTLRKPIDFAVVSVATVCAVEGGVWTDASIALGALAAGPVRATDVEDMILGRPADESSINEAADAVLSGAKPLSMNGYKINIAKSLIRKALA